VYFEPEGWDAVVLLDDGAVSDGEESGSPTPRAISIAHDGDATERQDSAEVAGTKLRSALLSRPRAAHRSWEQGSRCSPELPEDTLSAQTTFGTR